MAPYDKPGMVRNCALVFVARVAAQGYTGQGNSHEKPFEASLVTQGAVTLAGSGPVGWRHDGSILGIADLVGNHYEWVDGIKQVDGVFHLAANWRQSESEWLNTGVKVVDNGEGKPALSVGIEDPIDSNVGYTQILRMPSYEAVDAQIKKVMKWALIDPNFPFAGDGQGQVETRKTDTVYCRRCGHYASGDKAGLFAGHFREGSQRNAVRVVYVP